MKLKNILAVILFILSLGICGCTKEKYEKMKSEEAEAEISALMESKVRLSCDENGDFRTLIIADVHAVGTLPQNVSENIKTLVDREDPDLVIFTGDNTICDSEESLRAALDSMVGYIEEKGIAWCHVYGNHDHEGGMSKEEMQPIYESYDYCVSKWGDKDLHGVGNYVLPIYKHDSDEIFSLVWCLDSGNYLSDEDRMSLIPNTPTDFGGMESSPYDYIHSDQIYWYYSTSLAVEKYYGRKIPSLMAFHIPLQETYYAWENREALEHTGEKNEVVGASQINSGMFAALSARGDVLAVVNGHDHINDFMVLYNGIKLCYSPNVSTLTYHDTRMMGGRVFVINECNSSEIDTYVSHLFKE